jgi:hypothetical protein
MSEDGLFALIRAAPGGVDEAEAVEVDAVEETEAKRKQQPAQQQQQQQQQQAAGPSGTAPGSFYGGASKASAPAPKPGPAAAAPPRPGPAANQQLWVEKWRPKTSQELVGNIVSVWGGASAALHLLLPGCARKPAHAHTRLVALAPCFPADHRQHFAPVAA